MDPEKIETEMEFYGFPIEHFKREYEKWFRHHCKTKIANFCEKIIDSAQKELSVEAAKKLKTTSESSMPSVKLEIAKSVKRINKLCDKFFTVPENIHIYDDVNEFQNLPEMDAFEEQMAEKIDNMKKAYKQQTIMLQRLTAESEYYDAHLMDITDMDKQLCDAFDNYANDSTENDLDATQSLLRLTTLLGHANDTSGTSDKSGDSGGTEDDTIENTKN